MIETFDPNNSPTINLTANAIEHFKSFLNKTENGIALRIGLKKNGCSGLSYINEVVSETPIKHELIEIDGLKVFVDDDAKEYLEGTTVDFVQKDLGLSQVVYNNPKETARCGCGESFSVKGDSE